MENKPMPSGPVQLPVAGTTISGDLVVPADPSGLVVLAFASGGGRHRRDQRELASALNQEHMATLLVDILSAEEESVSVTEAREPPTDVLAGRIEAVLDWAHERDDIGALPFGILTEASTSPAALAAAARRPEEVKALVLRGGALDDPESHIEDVSSPTLVLVGDRAVEDAAKQASARMLGPVRVERLSSREPIAEEPEMSGVVARASSAWLGMHLH